MTKLQLGLIIAGVALVVGVIIYNAWQERRMRRRLAGTSRAHDRANVDTTSANRVEPTLGGGTTTTTATEPARAEGPSARAPTELPASPFAIPMDDVSVRRADTDDASGEPSELADRPDEADASQDDDDSAARDDGRGFGGSHSAPS